MPIPQPMSPGVYIDEIKSAVHTITGVATSIAAFVGRALKGPVDTPTAIDSFGAYQRTFGALSMSSPMGFAVRDFFLNGGSNALIVRVANGAGIAGINLTAGSDNLQLVAASPGKWGETLKATVDYDQLKATDTNLFNLTVTDGVTTEKFPSLSINADDSRFAPRILEGSLLVRVKRDSSGNYLMPTARPGTAAGVTSTGAGDGSDIGSAQIFSAGDKKGLHALDNADLFNLLVIPPYQFTGTNTDISETDYATAAAYCESRRAFLLIDPPATWNTAATALSGATASSGGFTNMSTNAALFFPRLMEANPLHGNTLESFVPSGAIAGVFARTDAQRGVWKSPAGTDAQLVGAAALTLSLTDSENASLNSVGVNCMRSFPVIGRVVWGARTLKGADVLADEWKYTAVRRTALFIEESLYRGTQWAVFEPNGDPLWAALRLNIGAFMQTMFRQGAFQGTSSREAYFVQCDSETTTQTDIDNGIVNIIVGFAPLKPAEFVIIHLQQMAGDIST